MTNITQPLLEDLLAKTRLNHAIDISIPLCFNGINPNAYYAKAPKQEIIKMGSFVGSVRQGGSVNYTQVMLTPHGNGTHTECYGHISADEHANMLLFNRFFFTAFLIEVPCMPVGGDWVISLEKVKSELQDNKPEALIIRTLPNNESKTTKNWSGTNPPYPEAGIGAWLAEQGILHWVVDVPSVDKEVDGGALVNHKGFWMMDGHESKIRKEATITELAFIPIEVSVGWYVLLLAPCRWNTDATPSRLVIYPVD